MGIKCLKRKLASQRFWAQASGLPVAAPALRSLRFVIDCTCSVLGMSLLDCGCVYRESNDLRSAKTADTSRPENAIQDFKSLCLDNDSCEANCTVHLF